MIFFVLDHDPDLRTDLEVEVDSEDEAVFVVEAEADTTKIIKTVVNTETQTMQEPETFK